MNFEKHHLVAAVTAVATVFFSGTAEAQYVSSYGQPPPLYPYVVQPQYVYPVPQYAQPYPYVQSPYVRSVPREYRTPPPPRRKAVKAVAKVEKTDPTLVEELRKGRHKNTKSLTASGNKDIVIDKKVVVREKPVVRKHIRVVDEPPIVVRREIDEQGRVLGEVQVPIEAQGPVPSGAARVIHAEAEVTILGPDRMSIRLYRKSDGRDSNAQALPAKPKKSTGRHDRNQPEG